MHLLSCMYIQVKYTITVVKKIMLHKIFIHLIRYIQFGSINIKYSKINIEQTIHVFHCIVVPLRIKK